MAGAGDPKGSIWKVNVQNARLCRAIGGRMEPDLTEEEGRGRARAVNERVIRWLLKMGPAEVKTKALTPSVLSNECLKRKDYRWRKKDTKSRNRAGHLNDVHADFRGAVSTYIIIIIIIVYIMCMSSWMPLKHHKQWYALKGKSQYSILIWYTPVNVQKWFLWRVCMAQMKARLKSYICVMFATLHFLMYHQTNPCESQFSW